MDLVTPQARAGNRGQRVGDELLRVPPTIDVRVCNSMEGVANLSYVLPVVFSWVIGRGVMGHPG